jgi:2-polyprenyl-6-methoxyphenol hydroxylase-like FAD-dependent oxidoreductase
VDRRHFHVLIVGGGIGGLCLVQGLKRAGISAAVYERDRTPAARSQGYRLNLEPAGARALHACMPTHIWDLLVAAAGDPGPRMGVFDEQLRELLQEDESGAVADPAHAHHAVSRITLRRLLLAGLEDVVSFDKQFVRYEQSDETVTAFFADGSSATGNVLVGADRARSRVRRQRLPNAREIDTPAVGVGGKLRLTAETAAWLPEHAMTTKNMILPPRDVLFTAAFRRRKSAADVMLQVGDQLRVMGLDPEDLLSETENGDYIMWAFVAHRRTLPSRLEDMGSREPSGASRLRDGDDCARLPGRARLTPLHTASDLTAAYIPRCGANVVSCVWIGAAAPAGGLQGAVNPMQSSRIFGRPFRDL